MAEDRVVGSMNFLVYIGNVQVGFSRISNLVYEAENTVIEEGGYNDFVHTVSEGKKEKHTIIFEKGVTRNSLDELKDVGLMPGDTITEPVVIRLLGPGGVSDEGDPIRIYSFDSGFVLRWEIGEFDAMGNSIMVDRIEIAHTGLIEVS